MEVVRTDPIVVNEKRERFSFAFYVLTGLFFVWGFITCLNDILVPYLKKLFVLSFLQATLVQFAFFGAYFIGSLVYFLSSFKYGDLIGRVGYKNCIIFGLLLDAFGCMLFYPAASLRLYSLFLVGLFMLGLGFTLLQIAANPYVAILGSSKGASSRLNFAQGINSLGTTIAPLIGGYFLFSQHESGNAIVGEKTLEHMYIFFAIVFLGLAAIFKYITLPSFKSPEVSLSAAGALKYPHLIMGTIAIFTYVGGEVSVGSLLISFFKLDSIASLSEAEGSQYVAFYWGGLMVGRFMGAVALSDALSTKIKSGLMIGIPLIAFLFTGVLLNWTTAFLWGICLCLSLAGFFIGKSLPARTLAVFASIIVGLLLVAILTSGKMAMWALIGVGLFNSILWSNIFTLSIRDLGSYTNSGSSLLIMAILGAAIVPVLQGGIADKIGLQLSFVVPLFCYIYLIYYGTKGYKLVLQDKR
jgi:FHS family L-fucose permease-like MFS transporter